MRVIAFYSPKGGVGKTASAVNIAYLASREGCSTLLWDLDSQGAASFYLAGAKPVQGKKLSKLLEGNAPIAKFIEENVYPDLDFIPAHKSFRNFDIKLDQEDGDKLLKSLLAPLSEDTSLVVLDCPPTLSRLTEQVMKIADQVYVPLLPTWLSMNSWDQFRQFVADKKLGTKKLRPFFAQVDRRKKLHRDLVDQRSDLLHNALRATIPYSSIVERMGEKGLPLEVLAPRSVPAENLRGMWSEIRRDLWRKGRRVVN